MKSLKINQQGRLTLVTQLVAAMVLAGSSVVVGKILTGSLPVFLGTFLTLLVAFICMVPLMYNRIEEVRNLTTREWAYLFLQGLCGIVLFRVFTLYGLKLTGALQAGILTGTTPAVLALLSWCMLKEPLSRTAITGTLCAVGGCVLVNFSLAENEAAGSNTLAGTTLILLAVVSESLFTICRKRIASSVSATVNTTVLIFCSMVLLVVPALVEAAHMDMPPDTRGILAAVYYGVFATVIAYLLWTSAVGRVDGATAGAATAAMPASSVLLASIFLGERLQLNQLGGFLLVVGGILITSLSARKNIGKR